MPTDGFHLTWTHLTWGIAALFYAVALYNCVRAVGNRTSSGAAIAWILLQLTLPYVGVPLYFLLGDFRIRGYVKRHRAAHAELDQVGLFLPPSPAPPTNRVPAAIRRTYDACRTVFDRFGTVFQPQLGTADLLVDGRDTFRAIFAAIAAAERYIVVQYYIVRNDRLGLELKRLLIEKAKAKIPVFMLYDDMGSFWLSSEYLADLRKAGVRIERFLPIGGLKRPFQLNFRNHRKLVAVDGQVAFTGGLNVGEEYAVRRRRTRTKLPYWRDTHLRLTGGAVLQMEDIFFEDWYFATGEIVDLKSLKGDPAASLMATEGTVPGAALVSPAAVSLDAAEPIVQVVPTGPTDEALISILLIMQLANLATKRLWIATPYFVPDSSLIRALELATLRGVDVRLMMPRRSDHAFVQWVSLSFGAQLQSQGVKVLLYNRGFMHQKVILVDDALAAVGTMNLDNRALFLNFETMVIVHGAEFAAKVTAMLEKDFLSCIFLRADGKGLMSSLRRLRGDLGRLFAPLL